MADVFISYARADEERAERIAQALRAKGYQVWRDDELPAHRAYAEVIEERLKSAQAVVVLWSAEAAKSQWVRAEADTARNAQTLVQAALDATTPPIPFNQIQCADLTEWDGDVQAPGWRKLGASIEALAGPANTSTADRRPPRHQKVSVCVLPFQNMSGDAEQEYFSDGISEDITTDLSKVSALEVIARNTAFSLKNQNIDVNEIVRKFGVTHVLEGSVRKAGSRVRITAQLIDGESGGHVWAERYDRDLTDIFAIQDEISKAIVEALRLKLLPSEKKAIEQRGTSNAEAYNLYLMARRYWIAGNWGDTRQLELVIRICQKAIDLDRGYARAWGLMAIVQCILHLTFNGSDDNGAAAADTALSLDPNVVEAICVRARFQYEGGDFAAADATLARAFALEPDSWEVNRETARILYFQRRFDEAARFYERAVAIDDGDFHSWAMLTSAYDALGEEEKLLYGARKAVEQSERVLVSDPMNGAALATVVTGLAILGERDRAKDWIERGLLIAPDNDVMHYNFACSMARLNDSDAAMALLEGVFEHLSPSAMKAFLADPDFDEMRSAGRLQELDSKAEAIVAAEQPSSAAAASSPRRS